MYNSTKIIRYIENLCLVFIYFISMNLREMCLWWCISIFFRLHYFVNLLWIWDIFYQEWKLSKMCNTNNALILWIKDLSVLIKLITSLHFFRSCGPAICWKRFQISRRMKAQPQWHSENCVFPKIPKFVPSLNEVDGKFGFEISYQF